MNTGDLEGIVPLQDAESEPDEIDAQDSQDPVDMDLVNRLIAQNQPRDDDDEDSQSPEEYLAANPPISFHDDPQALQAIMPQAPALPNAQDATHPASKSKLGKLWAIAGPVLKDAAIGGLAGSAGGNIGQGFQYAQQAAQNLQRMQMERQAAKDLSDWHQAQTARLQQQTAGMPQQQSAMNAYRTSRANYNDAQAAFFRARTDRLKVAPNDKLVHTYNGNDGKVHLVYQKPNGDAYERASDASFFVHPAAQPKPLLAHGHDHAVYLIDPQTGHSRKVIEGSTDAPPRKGTPAQFTQIEKYKQGEWDKVANDVLLSDAEKTNRLQNIQDHYERLITTLGGEPAHYVVPPQGSTQPISNPSAQNDPKDPLGLFK